MISYFFGSTIIYDIIAIAVVVLLIFIGIKIPQSRTIIASVFVLLYMGLTAYTGFQLNAYYNLEGGIYGHITKYFEENQKINKTDYGYSYKLCNVKLERTDDSTFSATITSSDKVELNKDKHYSLFINDVQLYGAEVTDKYITGNYTYQFLNNERQPVLTDTLYINIAMNDFNTTINISTKGGGTAVDYWYTYYTKNEFLIEIKEATFIEDTSKFNELPGNQSIKEKCNVTFIARRAKLVGMSYQSESYTYFSSVVVKGATLVLPPAPPDFSDSDGRHTFKYWTNGGWDDMKIYNGGETVNEDLTLYAYYDSHGGTIVV